MFQHRFLESTLGLSLTGLVYNRGGATERKGRYGVSHLMEHLLCKTYDDLRKDMRRLGLDYNAYTSENRTVFYWEGLSEELDGIIKTLINRVVDSREHLWTEEGFINERKTVVEEYLDSFNDQFSGAYTNWFRTHYNVFMPIGLREDIENFTYEDSIKEAEFYRNPHMLVEVCPTKTVGFTSSPTEADYVDLVFTENSGAPLETVPKTDKTVVGLLGKRPVEKSEYSKLAFVLGCLNNGLDSPLYQEIRELRGLSYFSASFQHVVGKKFVPFLGACTANERASELVDVYRQFFTSNFSNVISEERFDICKSDLLIQERKDNILVTGAGKMVMQDKNPYDALRELTYENVLELAATHLSFDNFTEVSY